ncbi:hypothetical protein ACS0TY_008032 [Phlomoides rotata]
MVRAKMINRILPRAFTSKPCRFSPSSAARPHSSLPQQNESPLPQMPPFDYTPPPYAGPSADEILKKRQEFLNPAVNHLFKQPLNLVDGKMQYLYDDKGRRYLDAFGGIATVACGHCHPVVVNAIVNQTKRLQYASILYLNPAIADFTKALASKFPVRNGYHGNAAGIMAATAQSSYKFNVVQNGLHHAQNPDQYRGIFGSDGAKYARDVDEIITYGTTGRVAGIIAESIQGVGGVLELAPGYLQEVYRTVRKAGGLCIADEVQSGFARTGHFLGYEAHGVVTDIVTMAKGIGNGMPLGAVITTPEEAKEKLQENAFTVGSYLKERLTTLKDKYEIIGDVRGRGLLLGVELVTDRQLKTPAKDRLFI